MAFSLAAPMVGTPPANSAPPVTFSSTVMSGNGCTTWNVRAMPSRAMRSGGRRSMRSSPYQNLAGAGPMHAGDEIDQGRLAGAVGTDQADDLTRPQFERDVVDGDQAAEAAGYVGEPQHGGHGAASPVRRRHQGFAHPAPRNPFGRNSTRHTTMMPSRPA